MKRVYLTDKTDTFLVIYGATDYQAIQGRVYTVTEFHILGSEKTGFMFYDTRGSDGDDVETTEEPTEHSEYLFEFLVNWRGIWDYRFWFPQFEFEEPDIFEQMHRVWQSMRVELAEEVCKLNPNADINEL